MDEGSSNIKKLQVVIAYFLIYVVWGSTYYIIGLALKELPPFLLGALRFSIAGILLLLWCYFRGERILNKSLIKQSAITGIVLLFIDMAVVMIAQQYVNSSIVAIFASSTAIWIMVFDVPMWKKNFSSPLAITGIVVGFAGVLMLYLEQQQNESIDQQHSIGILLLLFGCISWALGTLYTKYFFWRERKNNSFAGSAWQMIFASAMFWIAAFGSGETAAVQLSNVSGKSWLSVAYLILFGSILAYSAYIWLLKIRPATEVGTHAYVNPFIAILLGKTFGDEQVSLAQFIGLVLIVASIVLVSHKQIVNEKKKM